MPDLLILDPYHGGSHAAVTRTIERFSPLSCRSLTLPARHWKWRMGSAHVQFAKLINDENLQPSQLIATDMLDLSRLRGLCPQLAGTRCILLMHENQLSYPRPEADRADLHLGLTNLHSCLAADLVWWNSKHHRDDFLSQLKQVSTSLPDGGFKGAAEAVLARSQVLGLPLDLDELAPYRREDRQPGPLRIAWNHRRDHDKGAVEILEQLAQLATDGLDFELWLFGERFRRSPEGFEQALEAIGDRLGHDGFLEDRKDYLSKLAQADVLLSSSLQENFGLSVAEGIQLGLWPILPRGLCYPELIPAEYHQHCLYAAPEGLADLLTQAAAQPERRAGPWYRGFEAAKLLSKLLAD